MIIGLTGYARVGKDTVANILVKDFGFTRIAFADPIRDLLFEMNPLVNGVRVQDMVKEVRRLLQNLGVGARNLFGPTFWVDQAMRKIYDPDKNFVITDVRFINEADWLRVNGGYIWRVKRDGVVAINTHVSEHEMANYPEDLTLINEGSIDQLSDLITEQMDFLGAKKES
jgi:hypothetical protein